MVENRNSKKKLWWSAAIGLAAMGVLLLVMLFGHFSSPQNSAFVPSLIDTETLQHYERKNASDLDTSHVATGVVPPINKWFSGLALQANPTPVFAYPNSYLLKHDGFEVGLPTVNIFPNAVEANHEPGATVTIYGARSYKVVRYDELSVDVAYYDEENRELAIATFMAGVPIVPVVAKQAVSLETELERALVIHNQGVGGADERWFGVRQVDGRPTLENDKVVTKLTQGQFASIYSAPSRDSLDTVAEYALNRPMNATVEYSHNDKKAITKIALRTANNQPTMMALLPHHVSSETRSLFEYQSQFGPLKAAETRSLTYSTPSVRVESALSLARIDEAQKHTIRQQLAKDVESVRLDSSDPDAGGKQLQRAAQLLMLARELHDNEHASQLQQQLAAAFDDWADPSSSRGFYYDTTARGLVAKQASSDRKAFDMHHNTHGYFVYAAALLARYDPGFLDRHRAFVNLLVADIANYKDLEDMPLRRSYDPYVGHAWELSAVPHQNGNRQNSGAEAINAWSGVALWAAASSNENLEEQARWMLANEVASTKRYRMNIEIAGYDHEYFSSISGGRREWQMPSDSNSLERVQQGHYSPMTPTLAGVYPTKNDLDEYVTFDESGSYAYQLALKASRSLED